MVAWVADFFGSVCFLVRLRLWLLHILFCTLMMVQFFVYTPSINTINSPERVAALRIDLSPIGFCNEPLSGSKHTVKAMVMKSYCFLLQHI